MTSVSHTHNEWGKSLDQVPPDDHRELLHELAHSIHPAFSDLWYKWTPLHMREGFVEVIARILGKTQSELRDSKEYIKKRLPSELVDPLTLDAEGLFARSKQPLSINPAYLSTTAYVAGLSSLLGNRNISHGLHILKSVAEKEQDTDNFMAHLSNKVNGKLHDPVWRRNIQIDGIQRLVE